MNETEDFPISHPISVVELLQAEKIRVSIDAGPEERAALAEYLGIPEVRTLKADLILRAEPGRQFVLDGHVTAEIVQSCIATLNPVEARLDGPIRRVYQDGAAPEDDPEMDPFDDDTPDDVENGVIDAGAAVCEHIALEMEPYPRSPEAPEDDAAAAGASDDDGLGEDHPFAVLARMRNLEK